MTLSTYWQPQWTTEVKIESGGRYPLGLNRFHNGLEDLLIKSIVYNANRLRFFTYCCWAIGDIERTERCESYGDFVKAFVRRETALILGLCLIKDEDYPIQGSTRAMHALREDRESYDCSFSVMESSELGTFGLYYVGTAYNLGLIETNDEQIYTLTPSGSKLYHLAEARYRKLRPEYYEKYRGKREVPWPVLESWAKVNDFDNLRDPDNLAERQFFESLLFRLDDKRAPDYRRDSLAFFLACIDHCAANQVTFTEDVVRNINYYSYYRGNGGTIHPFSAPTHFADVHFYWRIYDGHVYFQGWLSKYFETFLNYLKGCSDGSTVDEFLAALDDQQFNETVNYFLQTNDEWIEGSFEALLSVIGSPAKLEMSFSEEALKLDNQLSAPSAVVAKFVLTLANLYVAFKDVRRDARYTFVASNLSNDLWFDALYHIPNLLQMPVRQLLRKILRTYILDQHDRIMMEKNDLRRCWFTSERGKYFWQSDVSVIWRSAKYPTAMSFLRDMNLVDQDDSLIWLTDEGRELYETLVRGYYS